MIEGIVTDHEGILQLSVQGLSGKRSVEAVIDTGYDGLLTLPPSLIEALRLPSRGDTDAILADGSVTSVPIYTATVVWDGRPRPVVVEEADTTPLVGMLLLDGCDLRMQCTEGGRVAVEALPE